MATITLPNNYIEIEQEEMMYLDGGALTTAQKALVIAVCAASAIAIAGLILVGSYAAIAAIMGVGLKAVLIDAGIAALSGQFVVCLGIASPIAQKICNALLKL